MLQPDLAEEVRRDRVAYGGNEANGRMGMTRPIQRRVNEFLVVNRGHLRKTLDKGVSCGSKLNTESQYNSKDLAAISRLLRSNRNEERGNTQKPQMRDVATLLFVDGIEPRGS